MFHFSLVAKVAKIAVHRVNIKGFSILIFLRCFTSILCCGLRLKENVLVIYLSIKLLYWSINSFSVVYSANQMPLLQIDVCRLCLHVYDCIIVWVFEMPYHWLKGISSQIRVLLKLLLLQHSSFEGAKFQSNMCGSHLKKLHAYTVTYVEGSVMLWGVFLSADTGHLVKTERMDGKNNKTTGEQKPSLEPALICSKLFFHFSRTITLDIN